MRRSTGRRSVDRGSTSRSAGLSYLPTYFGCGLFAFCLVLFTLVTTATSASGQSTVTSWSEGRAPGLAIVVEGEPTALSTDIEAISEALRDSPATSNFSVIPTSVDTSVIYINFVRDVDSELLGEVENIAEASSASTSVSVLGSGAADVRLRRSIESEALLAIGVVALVVSAILALLYGWQVGIGVASVLSVSAILATMSGSVLNPRFNGSILSTNLPAIVTSLVVVAMMGYHVTRNLSVVVASGDLRSALAASSEVLRQLLFPIAAVLGQLGLVWLVVELLFPSSNPILSSLVGAVSGAIVGLVLVPLLVQIGGVNFDQPSQRLRYILREHEMAQTVGIGVVALVVVVTVLGVLNSFGQPSAGSLDQRALGVRSTSATALNNNGDLTEAIVVSVPLDLDAASVDEFAVEVSNWPAVKLVQTSTVVVVAGNSTDNVRIGRGRSFEGLKTIDSQMILVVPNGAERSNSAEQLALGLETQDIISGLTVDTRRLSDIELEDRSGWLLVSVVFISCLGGLVAALALHGDRRLAFSFLLARLFLLLGVIGIGSSLIAAGSVDEIVLIVLAVVLVLAWFEVSCWTYQPAMLDNRRVSNHQDVSSSRRMRTPMRSSSVGLVSLAAVGVAWMFADAPYVRPLGMALVVVLVVVTAAINVLLPFLFQNGSAFEAGQLFLRGRGRRVFSLGPLLTSFTAQPFSRPRFRTATLPRLRFQRPDVDEPRSSDGERYIAPVDIYEATPDDETKDPTVYPDELDKRSDSVASNSLSATGNGRNRHRGGDIAREPVVAIDGFSDLSVAGEGGFAFVYRATSASGSPVAIKVLTATNDTNERRRFDREKDALEALSEVDGVVKLLGSGQTDSGAPYLVLTYLDGGTVARRIRTRPYNWHEAYELGCKLAKTLAVCHRKGVFHRDLKPSNVLLDGDEQPYLLDFGATQIVDGRSMSTRSAFTPNYCPPEVLVVGNEGSDSGLVDVYGLGILLWSMVAGRRPFVSGDSRGDEVPTVFNRVATQQLDPLVGVPEWFKQIVEKAIEKSPSKRFGSVAEMHTALVKRSLLHEIGIIPQAGNDKNSRRFIHTPNIRFGDLFARRKPSGPSLVSETKSRRTKLLEAPSLDSIKRVQKKRPRKEETVEVDWNAEASRLILADFELASSPDKHLVDEVYFPGTEIYRIAQRARADYLELGHQIVGDKPVVLKVEVINNDAPIRLEIVVAHPSYILLDLHGNQLQSTPFERRRSDLWLVETDDGYRISTIVLRTSEREEI